MFGISQAMFPLSAIIGMPMLGRLADNVGSKKALLYSLILSLIGYILCIFAVLLHFAWLFILGRFIAGFSSGTAAIANATIMDISISDGDKVKNLKFPVFASILGFIIGPGIALFSPTSYNQLSSTMIPFIITIFMIVVNLLLIIFFFPHQIITTKLNQQGVFVTLIKNILFILCLPNVKRIVYGYLIYLLGVGLFLQTLPITLDIIFGYSSKQIGLFFMIMCLVMSVSMFILHPMVSRNFKDFKQVNLSVFVVCVVMLSLTILLCLKPNIEVILFLTIIYYVFSPFITLNMTKIFSNFATNDQRGALMGGLGMISSIALALGSLIITVTLPLGEVFIALLTTILVFLGWMIIGGFKSINGKV